MAIYAEAGDENLLGVVFRRLRLTKGLLVVAAVWAAATVLGLLIAGNLVASSPSPAGSVDHAITVPGLGWNGNLYPLGPPGSGVAEKTTVKEAGAVAGFAVPLPHFAAAERGNLSQAWVSTNRRQVALVFSHGRVDVLMSHASSQAELNYFRAFVGQRNKNRVVSRIGEVNGLPALVIKRDTDAFTHSNPAVVEFDFNGIAISVYSHTYGSDTLLAIADSIR